MVRGKEFINYKRCESKVEHGGGASSGPVTVTTGDYQNTDSMSQNILKSARLALPCENGCDVGADQIIMRCIFDVSDKAAGAGWITLVAREGDEVEMVSPIEYLKGSASEQLYAVTQNNNGNPIINGYLRLVVGDGGTAVNPVTPIDHAHSKWETWGGYTPGFTAAALLQLPLVTEGQPEAITSKISDGSEIFATVEVCRLRFAY